VNLIGILGKRKCGARGVLQKLIGERLWAQWKFQGNLPLNLDVFDTLFPRILRTTPVVCRDSASVM